MLLAILLAASLTSCKKGKAWQEREVDYHLVHVDTEHLHLRHDLIGHGKWEARATFALVDAQNTHGEDLLVTLAGEFADKDGRVVGTMRPESLRIPAGGARTFAMIDQDNALRPDAVTARVRVVGAYVPSYVAPVQITDGKVYPDGDRVVVKGMVRNAVDQPVRVIIIAGFHDREGKPLTRPFTEMTLAGLGDHPAQFVGPPGSVKGYIFVGDMVY